MHTQSSSYSQREVPDRIVSLTIDPRTDQVQGVFDEIQKKAVEYYKSSPVKTSSTAAKGSGKGAKAAPGGVATPLPEAVQLLEAQLEVSLVFVFFCC